MTAHQPTVTSCCLGVSDKDNKTKKKTTQKQPKMKIIDYTYP